MGRKFKKKGKGKQKNKMLQDPQDMALAASASSSAVHSPVDSGEDDAKVWFDSSPSFHNVTEVTEPDTPTKPFSKKTKREETGTAMASNNESILDVMAAIQELSAKHDATFHKISKIEKTTQATSREIESLSVKVKQLVVDVSENKKELHQMQSEIQHLKAENSTLKTTLNESRRYSWKCFLKLHGLEESDGENVRTRVIDILQQVAPDVCDSLHAGVDIVHRLGSKQERKNRSIIILFAVRRVRDAVWHAVRKSKYLQAKHLTITEPLSPEDRAARERLWPLVKKAREEGKKASFKSSFALIDGKKYDFSDVG